MTHHHHIAPEITIKSGGVEFNVKGYSAEDVVVIVNGLSLNSEGKPEPTIKVSLPDNGHNFDPELQTEAPSTKRKRINAIRDLKTGDKIESIRSGAGDYFFWKEGEVGEVAEIDFDDALIVLIYQGESNFGKQAREWSFYDHEILEQFVKIPEGV